MLPKKKPVTKQLELDLEPPEQYELFGSDVDFTINLNDVMSDPNWYSTGMNTMATTGTYSIGNTTTTITLGDCSTITEDFATSDFQHLQEQLDAINERLAILQPNLEHLEKYEALREAYEHYKTLERLVKNG
jgi:hypothetical protein